MPLRGVMVEEAEYKMGANYCFTIYGGNRALTVAASSQEEKDKWIEDLQSAINNVRDREDREGKLQYLSLKSCSEYSWYLCTLFLAIFVYWNNGVLVFQRFL